MNNSLIPRIQDVQLKQDTLRQLGQLNTVFESFSEDYDTFEEVGTQLTDALNDFNNNIDTKQDAILENLNSAENTIRRILRRLERQ